MLWCREKVGRVLSPTQVLFLEQQVGLTVELLVNLSILDPLLLFLDR